MDALGLGLGGKVATGVPAMHADASLADFTASGLEEKARKLAQTARTGSPAVIALLGGKGSGKTRMACGLLNDRGVRRYTLYPEVAAETFAAWPALRRALIASPLLVLDECSERIGSAVDSSRLADLVVARHDELRPTVLIAHERPEIFAGGERAATVGESIASRLRHEHSLIIDFGGLPDLRGRASGVGS